MDRPPFPEVVDSTILSTFKDCNQKAFRAYFEHWRPGEKSVHLEAGGAFAEGVEVARHAFYVEKDPADTAVAKGLIALLKKYGDYEAPEDSPKSWLRMAGALEYYFSVFPLGVDKAIPRTFGDRRGIEFSFAEPLPVRHPVTGNPILYAGRADMVADAMGGVFIYDEKTTTSLGKTWLKKWDHRSQFTSYCWGLRGHDIHPTGIVVRGISILKTSYDSAQAITYRADWEVERWLEITVRQVERMVEAWKTGIWDHNLDHACASFSGCEFSRPCKSQDPERWLKIGFHKRRWDPLRRVAELLES